MDMSVTWAHGSSVPAKMSIIPGATPTEQYWKTAFQLNGDSLNKVYVIGICAILVENQEYFTISGFPIVLASSVDTSFVKDDGILSFGIFVSIRM